MTAFNHAHQSVRRWTQAQPAPISHVRQFLDNAETRAQELAAERWLSREIPRWEEEQAARVGDAAGVLVERRDGVVAAAGIVQSRLRDLRDDLANGRITATQARGRLRDHANSLGLMRAEIESIPQRNAEIQQVAELDVADWQEGLLRQVPTLRDSLASWPPAD